MKKVLVTVAAICLSFAAMSQEYRKNSYSNKETIKMDSSTLVVKKGCRQARYKLVRSSNGKSVYRRANGETVVVKDNGRGTVCFNNVKYNVSREYRNKKKD